VTDAEGWAANAEGYGKTAQPIAFNPRDGGAMPKKETELEGIAVTRLLPNICTDKMEETRDFYAELLGFVVGFEHQGWYIQMASPTHPQIQDGIMRRNHEFTPEGFQQPAQGVIISVQVEDVDAAYTEVLKRGFRIEHERCDESFGMRRFMVADPNGLLINLFSFP
jgi:catechol 2,3-dioxygenase-like lactoylglutathione lyase family enzyme